MCTQYVLIGLFELDFYHISNKLNTQRFNLCWKIIIESDFDISIKQ